MLAVKSREPPTGTPWEAAVSDSFTSDAPQSLTPLVFFGAGTDSRAIGVGRSRLTPSATPRPRLYTQNTTSETAASTTTSATARRRRYIARRCGLTTRLRGFCREPGRG